MIGKETTTSMPKIYALPSKRHVQAIRGNDANSGNPLRLKKCTLWFGKHATPLSFCFHFCSKPDTVSYLVMSYLYTEWSGGICAYRRPRNGHKGRSSIHWLVLALLATSASVPTAGSLLLLKSATPAQMSKVMARTNVGM
jgi:hypothetical protein